MDFFNDIFHNLALLEFYFLNIIYILLYIDFILSIFFQHSNILTRASHHWCLASNIVLVAWLLLQPCEVLIHARRDCFIDMTKILCDNIKWSIWLDSQIAFVKHFLSLIDDHFDGIFRAFLTMHTTALVSVCLFNYIAMSDEVCSFYVKICLFINSIQTQLRFKRLRFKRALSTVHSSIPTKLHHQVEAKWPIYVSVK